MGFTNVKSRLDSAQFGLRPLLKQRIDSALHSWVTEPIRRRSTSHCRRPPWAGKDQEM